MKSMLDIPSVALRTSCSISDMVLFQFVAKFHMFFLLYASTTLSMLPEDWLDARGNHLVSFD